MQMNNNQPQPDAKTILAVDDDVSVLTVVKCMLECGNYNVLLADSFNAALRIANRDDMAIDLMIVDVVMPGISGPDLAERILVIRPQMKVLFISGYTDSEMVRIKVLDRCLSFLPKPFTSDGLLETVERILSAPMTLTIGAGLGPPSRAFTES